MIFFEKKHTHTEKKKKKEKKKNGLCGSIMAF